MPEGEIARNGELDLRTTGLPTKDVEPAANAIRSLPHP